MCLIRFFHILPSFPGHFFQKHCMMPAIRLVSNRHMITKIYFPRMILPLASVLAGVVDFFIAFIVLIAMMIFYGIAPTSKYLDSTVFSRSGFDHGNWGRIMALCAECALSRYGLCAPFPDPILDVPDAYCLSFQHGSSAIIRFYMRLTR